MHALCNVAKLPIFKTLLAPNPANRVHIPNLEMPDKLKNSLQKELNTVQLRAVELSLRPMSRISLIQGCDVCFSFEGISVAPCQYYSYYI